MAKKCITANCENDATPGDFREMCITCNPYGDSLVMNNDPEYTRWLFRPDEYYDDYSDDDNYNN